MPQAYSGGAKMKLHRILARLFRRRHSAPASTARIVYALPDISVYKKLYNQGEFFHDVDWNNWNSVVDGFETRFEKWYFDHMAGGHASYVDLCSLCALVEVFSHYSSSEKEWHEPKHYKEFLRKLDPVFRKDLQAPVQINRYDAGRWKRGELKDYADVFYAGVRCSLHHHGDLASFAGMSGTGQLVIERANAGRSLCGKYRYSLVVFDPEQLKLRLRQWLRNYCENLKEAPGGSVARRFRDRFEMDFGIAIP